MNLFKITLSLLVTAAPAAARLSSDEKDSSASAVMRELMTKVDSMQSEVASLKADNEALKSKVASLEKRRGLMPEIDGMELPDIDVKDLTDLLDVEVDPSSGGGHLEEILFGIINQLVGLKRCVGFDPNSVGRRQSGERRLSPGYPTSGGTCFFGGDDIDAVFMEADEYIQVGSDGTDEIFIASNTFVGLKSGLITDLSNNRLSQAFRSHRTFGPNFKDGQVQVNGDFFSNNPSFPQQPKSSFLPSAPVFSLSTAAANSTDDSV